MQSVRDISAILLTVVGMTERTNIYIYIYIYKHMHMCLYNIDSKLVGFLRKGVSFSVLFTLYCLHR